MTLPDIDSLDTLGGIKVNSHPVEDPTTDLDADQDNIARADVAGMTHTAFRAFVRFTAATTTGALIRVAHDATWGNSSLVAPTLARSSTGTFTITYATTQTDELNESHTLNLRAAIANAREATHLVYCAPTSANVVTVRVTDLAGVANDAAGVDFDVFIF